MNVDFADRDGAIWMDGRLIPWRDANMHFLSHSLHYGSAVFEGVRAYGGRIFKLREHTERLIDGAAILGYRIPFDARQIDAACMQVLAANGLRDGYLRPAAWRGSDKVGLSPGGATVHVAVAAWEWPSYFSPEQRRIGIGLQHARWRRPSPDSAPTRAKASGLYQICTMAKQEAEAEGCDDALMLDYRGLIAEATGANIFLSIDGRLHTPIPDCFLDGITRRTVIELADRAGIDVVERHMEPSELALADEVFLTGTAAEITPVGKIGALRFKPGRITAAMIDGYASLTGSDALRSDLP